MCDKPKNIKIRLKIIIFSALLILLSSQNYVIGQSPEIDSLQQLLTIEKNDSVLIEINRTLHSRYYGINKDSTIMYAKNALGLAEGINNIYLIAKVQEELGLAYVLFQNPDLGLEFALKSAQNYTLIQDTFGLNQLSATAFGNAYIELGNYEKAQEHFEKALEYFISINNKDYVSYLNYNLGLLFYNQDMFQDALEYYIKGLELIKETNWQTDPSIRRNMGVYYERIGEIHTELGNYPEAFENINKALEIYESLNLTDMIHVNKVLLAVIHRNLKEYPEAIEDALIAFHFEKEMNYINLRISSSKEL